MLGGLVFGIALFRAGVLARWAAVLLAVATVGTAALAVLPDLVQPAHGRSRRRRPHRPRDLAVARPAYHRGHPGGHRTGQPRPSPPPSDEHPDDRDNAGPPGPATQLAGPGRAGRPRAIPLTAGALRLVQLAGGPAAMPADHRFTGFPVALVAHIVGAALFALIGAFQFVPRLRRA